MTTLQTGDDCQANDPNNLLPIESLRLPLDNSMRFLFTGYCNGFCVEVRSEEESALLYHMGCFGKGSTSRSKPRSAMSSDPVIMRKRQFLKRNYWYKKFWSQSPPSDDTFFKEVDALTARIISDADRQCGKDVIDLVSSEEDLSSDNEDMTNLPPSKPPFQGHEKDDVIVIVPNSDSEDENYFAKMKPKCCVNKTKLQEKLMLTLEESFFLLFGLGCLQIINCDNKLLSIQTSWDLFVETDHRFLLKYIVYHYYRSKGYVVKPGVKFGGDYLLYKEGPSVRHADYIVVAKHEGYYLNCLAVLGHVRMATTTVKEIIVADVIAPREKDLKLPQDLKYYTVKETFLTRKIPVAINEDAD